ncbi:hypothetical protein QN277_011662 [Acacia crassicarpa]|uniref:rRNA N-glycosylase n=1 Tax=Acacia crassicarpa TaxID=499986 RepID=A0AAE1MZN5_9FABA|nr:hypothetical protein QN277_011662 [Acacia crassicarpa]
MVVEFTEEFNVQSSTKGGYRDFIQRLRSRLGVRSSHNLPALAVQRNPPTQFFDLALRTSRHAVWFRFRMDNLYLLGYRMENGQWLEFDNRNENKELVHLIAEPGTTFLGFDGSYGALENVANRNITSIRVGVHNLEEAINQLAVTTDRATRARSLVVVIMIISESTRLIPVFNFVADSFDNRSHTTPDTESLIQLWIMVLVRCWASLSAALLRADAYPDEKFQLRPNNIRIPPNDTEIRTIADAVAILGILLGLCFYPTRRMATNSDGQCFLGLPLVQVFTVQINNIYDKDPRQLYGKITVDNGLYTESLYDRTSDNYESIKPGQNASLIGPSESVSAFGNVIIKLLLTNKGTHSGDSAIINQVISWDSANMADVYDELISQKLDDSGRGSVTVNYAVLRNAAAARVTVTVQETTKVYGHVSACYDKWEDPKTTCLLFDKTSDNYVEVKRLETIPMSRSVVAVPLDRTLKVTGSLKDSVGGVIANGTVEIPVPGTIPSTTVKRINGENGKWVTVTVSWSSGF